MSVSAINIKKEQVTEVAERINNSAATVVVQYSGLTVEEMKSLRSDLRAEGVELSVLKNNISRRAFAEAKIEGMEEELVGPTAVAFSKDDVTAAARILNDFAKSNDKLILKAGTMDGAFAPAEQVKELATLPNKEGLLSMLLSVMEAPVRGLAQVTNQIAGQKEEQE